MRTRALIILAAAALLAGCTKNTVDIPENVSISFAPVASKATKAIIEGTSYPTSESFAVSAYLEGTSAYFENLTASYNSTVTLWETSTAQYWPLGGSLSFVAYSPASAAGTITSGGVTFTDYTVQTTAQMTTDLCWASATVPDCSTHPESVHLDFSHALSQIVFCVKPAAYYENTSLSLTSLSMNGINSVGDFADEAWENQHTEYSYTLSSTPTAATYDGTTPVATNVCSYLFIPQELGPNAAINVGYSITFAGGRFFENSPVTIGLGGTVTQWEAGKKYIYTLNIGLNNLITITASAVGWADENFDIIVEES